MTCDLNFSEDQRQILDAADAMLETSYPVNRLRQGARDDIGAIASFGAFGLTLHQDHGGDGFSLVEEALLHVRFGRHALTSRTIGGSVGARLAAALGLSELATEISAGHLGVAAAVPAESGLLIADAENARLALVFGDGWLGIVEANEPAGEQVAGLGHGIPLRRVAHNGYTTLGESRDDHLTESADLLLSAQLLGIAETTRDLAVSYAKVREQFGKPIGSFQAIKHHCANMAIGAEMLSSQLDMAAIALRDRRDDAHFQIAALRLLAPRTALANARTCIQIHGGIGFSAEADAHHFLKQAHLLSRLVHHQTFLKLAAPLAPHSSKDERT